MINKDTTPSQGCKVYIILDDILNQGTHVSSLNFAKVGDKFSYWNWNFRATLYIGCSIVFYQW